MTVIGNAGPMRGQFWMVYGEGQRSPTYKHDSEHAAELEAQRLAIEHPGIAFYALKAKHAYVSTPPKHKGWKLKKRKPSEPSDDDLPF